MIEKIRQWLANPKRKYAEGVNLYMKIRTDNKFDKFLQDVSDPSETSLPFKMLIQKLSNLLRIEEAKPKRNIIEDVKPVDQTKAKPINVDKIAMPKAAAKLPKIDANPYLRIEDLPEELQQEYETVIKPLTKEIAHYHEVSKIANNDAERKEAINLAAKLEEQQAEAWSKLDTWYKTNILKEVPEEQNTVLITVNPVKEAIEIVGRIDDLKTNINRANKELETLKDKKKIETRTKNLQAWNEELEHKKLRLTELTGE